jgi:hypothetical protein
LGRLPRHKAHHIRRNVEKVIMLTRPVHAANQIAFRIPITRWRTEVCRAAFRPSSCQGPEKASVSRPGRGIGTLEVSDYFTVGRRARENNVLKQPFAKLARILLDLREHSFS